MKRYWMFSLMLLLVLGVARADGPGDNLPDNVRRIPQPGVAVPEGDRTELQTGIDALGREITELKSSLKAKQELLDLLPDVQIYYNAARYALTYNEFFSPNEIKTGKDLLKQGMDRAGQLKQGQHSWTTQTGPVARGYISKIDNSIQPYGIVVPTDYQATGDSSRHRLDIWYHGRGETLSELNFINDRQRNLGEFHPEGAFVLHPYGRYCNANRFAGETDTFEALDQVRRSYPIDNDRIAVRGFSMGGAACWLFATHYSGLWAAANPGAGFSETADFLKVFQNESTKPTWYEQKMWHLYDSIDYAVNLFNLPTVAYSGEIDGQRQAAVMMEKAMAEEGLTLTHIIGPKAGHFYEKNAKEEVARRVDALVAQGNNPWPNSIKFTTWTLKYNKLKWLTVDSMEKEWERARVEAEFTSPRIVTVKTQNVTGLTLLYPKPMDRSVSRPQATIDGQNLALPEGLAASFHKTNGKWAVVKSANDGKLAKRHNLQGPIDDAFMDSFIMVKPTGTPINAKLAAWTQKEMAHATEHWRRQFRGEARIKNDTEISKEDIANSNLILWGDPNSNAILAKIAGKLPIRWDTLGVHVGGKTYAPDAAVPVLIYPNPLNPKKYIVLNSGFTYREYDYLNNARQTPKLPDWAIVDINTPMTSRAPGTILDAAFFGERWELTFDHQ